MNSLLDTIITAVNDGDEDRVKRLAPRLESKSACDQCGWTPLFWACACGNLDILMALIKLGWEVNRTDHNGRTIYDIATAAEKQTIVEYLKAHFFSDFAHIRYVQRCKATVQIDQVVFFSEETETTINKDKMLFGDNQ